MVALLQYFAAVRAFMSIDDQKRGSELHGEAHKVARDEVGATLPRLRRFCIMAASGTQNLPRSEAP